MVSNVLPMGAGVAFKPIHYEPLLADPSRVDFIEVHAENYFGDGGLMHAQLTALRNLLPLSIHGVGLSLGGVDPLDWQHLRRLKLLCERYDPALVSEHLAWSSHAGNYLSDLLPISYTQNTLREITERIQQVQECLGRQIFIENPSRYLSLVESEIDEAEFLSLLCERSGCGLLLDINNLIVSCRNCGGDPLGYINRLPIDRVGEIHLAGHSVIQRPGGEFAIDDHASAVGDSTWVLYTEWLQVAGPKPSLIEWDREIPSWTTLAAEVDCARAFLWPCKT